MSVALNTDGYRHAMALLTVGQVDRESAWDMTTADEDALLGTPPDWPGYATWFLGARPGSAPDVKQTWVYPFGKGGKVYRSALTAIRQRAGQQGDQEVFDGAGKLLELVDGAGAIVAKSVPLVCTAGGGAPEWVMLVPAGTVVTDKYPPFLCDREAMALTMAQVNSLGHDLVIDYEHQTLLGEYRSRDGTAPAAGWIKELQPRDTGLWGRVEWTAKGGGMVAAKEYRYLSPVVLPRKSDNRMFWMHSAGLVNDPAIRGMRPLVNKADLNTKEQLMKTQIIGLLSLKADASDDDVLNAVKAGKEFRDGMLQALALKAEATVADANGAIGVLREFRAGLVEALALKAEATPADARGAILVLKNPTGFVPVADFHALKARLDGRDADDLVEGAVAAGKVTPANREWARAYALKDEAGFKAFVEKAPVVVQPGQVARDVSGGGGGAAGVTEIELAICKQLGVKPEAFKAAQKAEKEV